MKKIILFSFLTLLLTGCGFHNGLTHNNNTHNTDVVLSQRNFRVVANLQGTSETLLILGIGGMSKSAMIAEAKAEILQKADMVGKARAIVNETVEVHNSFFLIGSKRKVTVTAQIVEFVNTNARNQAMND